MSFKEYLIKIYPLWDGQDLSCFKVPASQMIIHAEAWAAQNFGNQHFVNDFWHTTNTHESKEVDIQHPKK